ncbi:MAG TPA: response regulator [Candidatus Acidoferrum sp.]|nr:response regulator [Candidatus Acidoferrum sp.]
MASIPIVRGTHVTTQRKAVLVVCYDDAVLHLCSYVIHENGMSAYTAWEPGAAIRTLADVSIDLVVTDLDFPALDGVDLTHHVRSNYSDTQVVVLSRFGDVDGAVRAVRGGATDYLAKPFSFDEFRRKLVEWEGSRGAFRKWARTEPEGLPVERTLGGPLDMSLIERHGKEVGTDALADLGDTEHRRRAAIVNDAVRTLRQIIRRDLQETALFAAISEEELLKAFLSSPQGQEL